MLPKHLEFQESGLIRTCKGNKMAANCSAAEPTMVEFMEEILANVELMVMMVVTSVITVILLLAYLGSSIFVASKIPHRDRSISLIFMLGVYPIFAATSQMGLYIPKAVLMCNLTAAIYFSISLYHFLQLIIYYYGGYDAAIRKTGEHQVFAAYQLDENSFTWIEIAIYQMAIVRPCVLFVEDILWLNGTYNTSSITKDDAFLYLNVITLVSSLIAIMALTILYLASRDHLKPFFITIKFVVVGLALYFSNMQILLLDVLTFANVIPCKEPFNSESRANSWQCLLLIIESGILFPICYCYFRTRRGNIVGILDIGQSPSWSKQLLEKNGNLKNPLLNRVKAESATSMLRDRSSSSPHNSYTTV